MYKKHNTILSCNLQVAYMRAAGLVCSACSSCSTYWEQGSGSHHGLGHAAPCDAQRLDVEGEGSHTTTSPSHDGSDGLSTGTPCVLYSYHTHTRHTHTMTHTEAQADGPHTHTMTHTDHDTHRSTDRHTHTEAQTDGPHTHTHTHTERDRQMDPHTPHTHTHTHRTVFTIRVGSTVQPDLPYLKCKKNTQLKRLPRSC